MNKRFFWFISLTIIMSLVLVSCVGQADMPTEEIVEEETEVAEETEIEVTETEEEPAVEEEPELIELIVWADELRAPIIDGLGNQFANEYGIKLTIQQLGFGDIRDQLAVAGPAGEGPDIIIGAHDWLGQLVSNGLVSTLDLGEKESEFLDASISAFVYDGELYGLPYATENIAFFCNADIIDTAPTTWDEVTTLAEQLEEESDGEVTAWTIQTNDPYHHFPLMNSFGGYVFGLTEEGYDPDDVGIDSPGAIASAEWLQSMVEAGHLTPDVDYDVLHTLFTTGKVACIGTGPWALSAIRDSGVNYFISPFPAGDVGPGSPFLGVQGFMISAFSENQILAQTVLNEIFATEEFMQAMYDVDPRPSAYLAVRDATEDTDIAAFGIAGTTGLAMPAIPAMSSVWEAWGNATFLIITQELDATTAYTDAANQIRTLIEE